MKLRIPIYLLIVLVSVQCQKQLPEDVQFRKDLPAIDGFLDTQYKDLTRREFNYIWQFDNPVTDTVPVTYRLAYTPSHLYLHIEAEVDSINYRRRGFVHGDGFKLLIAKPQQDSLTNEYYDLVFSASKDKNYWARKRIWEYNHDQSYNKPLSEGSKFQEAYENGKSGFEALISWEDIPPYHPWFMDEIGYNLYFAKAIGDTITNGYAVVEDEGIWDEEVPQRNYELLDFEIPQNTTETLVQTRLNQRNIVSGRSVDLAIASVASQNDMKTLQVEIKYGEKVVHEQKIQMTFSTHFKKETQQLRTHKLEEGNYKVIVKSDEEILLESGFTILPDIDLVEIYQAVQANPESISTGAQQTLMFKIQQYAEGLKKLKEYEMAEQLLEQFVVGNTEFNQFVNGIDPYAAKKIPYRRAFLSKQDSTYQPYSIKLPKDYDLQKRYPLLVFLHGSGSTDKGLLNAARSGGDFIELAPYGRDMYRAYASPKSQKDIVEAIEDVSKYFAVDTDKIIVGGFSMGGYGALRAFYENPQIYKGVAIHAGHPDLANYWLGNGFPDFLDEKYLEAFKGKSVFIYHGEKDGSLPVDLMKEMALKMKQLGIDVELHLVPEKGHEYPDEKTNRAYFNWLNKVVK